MASTEAATTRHAELVDNLRDSLLLDLIGTELAAVVFVRDYVQLDFDGPRLSLFVWPLVIADGGQRGVLDDGYRDGLCALIGQVVVSARDEAGIGLVLDFERGQLVVNPHPSEVIGPEIAMLAGFPGRKVWMMWRPGEGAFS